MRVHWYMVCSILTFMLYVNTGSKIASDLLSPALSYFPCIFVRLKRRLPFQKRVMFYTWSITKPKSSFSRQLGWRCLTHTVFTIILVLRCKIPFFLMNSLLFWPLPYFVLNRWAFRRKHNPEQSINSGGNYVSSNALGQLFPISLTNDCLSEDNRVAGEIAAPSCALFI